MNRLMTILLFVCSLASICAAAQQTPSTEESLGALLYSTHCVACHTSQIHWRDNKLAKDWVSLQAQVRRWQSNSGLGWSDDDIVEVTRYLNQKYYRFPESGNEISFRELRDRASAAGERRSTAVPLSVLFRPRIPLVKPAGLLQQKFFLRRREIEALAR
jgi:hypothetical protein